MAQFQFMLPVWGASCGILFAFGNNCFNSRSPPGEHTVTLNFSANFFRFNSCSRVGITITNGHMGLLSVVSIHVPRMGSINER